MTNQQGFTLIESLVSVAFISIGFVGVLGLVNVSNDMLHNSIERERLNQESNAIMETLTSDVASLEFYKNKDLGNCGALAKNNKKGKEVQHQRVIQWCKKVEGRMGIAHSKDIRTIHVNKKTISGKDVYFVAVELTSRDGKNSSSVMRAFNAP